MRQFLVELQRKIDRGTPFQQWFYGQERHHEIQNFTAWLVRAREYGALLPDGLEKHKAAAEQHYSAEEQWNGEQWYDGWDYENGDWYANQDGWEEGGDEEGDLLNEVTEAVQRLNDSRLARTGLKKPAGGHVAA